MINIALNLGKVALAISCAIKESEQIKLVAKGIASESYRAVGSKVYGPKGFARDTAFSELLATAVKNAAQEVLSPYCESLTIETSMRKEGAPKLTVESVLASLDTQQLEKLLAERKAAKVEPEAEVVAMG